MKPRLRKYAAEQGIVAALKQGLEAKSKEFVARATRLTRRRNSDIRFSRAHLRFLQPCRWLTCLAERRWKEEGSMRRRVKPELPSGKKGPGASGATEPGVRSISDDHDVEKSSGRAEVNEIRPGGDAFGGEDRAAHIRPVQTRERTGGFHAIRLPGH